MIPRILKIAVAATIGLMSVWLMAQRAQAPLTNADVLKMVKAGVPEVQIVKSMQFRGAKFDLSPDALLALQREGAGQNVLKAMEIKSQTDGGITGDGRVVRKASELPSEMLKIGPAKTAQKITNPRAMHLNETTIAVLQKQRSVADVEAAQMRVPVRAPAQVGTIGQSQTTSATTGSRTKQVVQSRAAKVVVNDGTKPSAQPAKSTTTSAPNALIQRTPSTVTTAPSQTQVGSGITPMLRASSAPVLMQTPGGTAGPSVPGGSAGPSNQGGSAGPSTQPQNIGGGLSSLRPANGGNSGSGNGGVVTNGSGLLNMNNRGNAGNANGGSGVSTPNNGSNGGVVTNGSGLLNMNNGGNAGNPNGGSGVSTPNNKLTSMGQLHNFENNALVCAQNSQFRILNVSGSSFPATFTPIDQYNLYTITGCSFGNASPNNKVYVYGTGQFQGNFNIKFWNDNSIALSLDESISGFPDLDNLTLVVQRSDGQQTQKGGFKFYAARQTVELKTIPTSWVKLATLTSGFKTLNAEYSSPPTSDQGGPGPGAGSAYISRYFYGAKFDPISTFDHFYFNNLAPGWNTDSFQLTTYPLDCPYTVTWRQNFGSWSSGWDGNNIYVGLSDTSCSGFNPASMVLGIPLNIYQNRTGSYYALKVWVTGPRGLDPLTNNRMQ